MVEDTLFSGESKNIEYKVSLEQQLTDWCEKKNMSYHRKQSGK